ncbi:MAG: cellulase family glycosylhydrolase [Opitutaceae bacterium]|jgi:hypothetical protein|nr:cellulase family glycosylhydrolase [Opitutaceae bacterium]
MSPDFPRLQFSKTAMSIFYIRASLALATFAFAFAPPPALATNANAHANNQSRTLAVSGNQIVLADDPLVIVRLTGLNVPGCEWSANPVYGRVPRSIKEAMENWHANVIRIPVSVTGWNGRLPDSAGPDGDGEKYKQWIDSFIQMVAEAGKYAVLDLHHYKQFDNPAYLDFWREAAVRYKNNPAVLFGILNEPHGTTWEIWRNGDGAGVTGHQQVVELIRDLGARNIIIAGGLDWAYDLTGIAGGFELIDQGSGGDLSKRGNGIVYDTHIYPWKGGRENWDAKVAAVRRRHPIFVGENGFDPSDKTQQQFAPDARHETWAPELFAWKNDGAAFGNLAHWAGWCFHNTATPVILRGSAAEFHDDAHYDYPPTEFWGVYVKKELETALGKNLLAGARVTCADAASDFANATDGDIRSLWECATAGPKMLTADLGKPRTFNRWIVRHYSSGEKLISQDSTMSAGAGRNTADFKLQTSMDGKTWKDAGTITGNTAGVTDRFIRQQTARHVRLIITKASAVDDIARIYEFSVYGN